MKKYAVVVVFGLIFLTACQTKVLTSPEASSWIIDSEKDWKNAKGESTHISLSGGFAEPSAEKAAFGSIVKTFKEKKKPRKITFKQSPVWDNWTQIEDITPTNVGNALVFIPVAPGDYYLLAEIDVKLNYPKGSTADERRAMRKRYIEENKVPRGYHAWHSTDLKEWTFHGQISYSKWVTTAEYVDGKFYIYYDRPNDQDPHLIIDEDLKDGKVGKEMGMVFSDPSNGSDVGIFRDEDGTFHMIYEDWTPISAAEHAFDSPLAGHTSSPDGIHGFTPHEHAYAIDHRTTPTGKIGKDRRGTPYEIHEPEQNAYGDYTMIKVGKQYYLFCDYHPKEPGKSMRLGRFTTDDIHKEFSWAGEIGAGFHPDPSVGFAEGKFYIVMQQKTDFVSPGPWVDGVEARVGVDVDGDGRIDNWTKWQRVNETYSQKPGFVRIADVAPAQIDLNSLPAGYGFKFEFKTAQLKDNQVQPIMDSVRLMFK